MAEPLPLSPPPHLNSSQQPLSSFQTSFECVDRDGGREGQLSPRQWKWFNSSTGTTTMSVRAKQTGISEFSLALMDVTPCRQHPHNNKTSAKLQKLSPAPSGTPLPQHSKVKHCNSSGEHEHNERWNFRILVPKECCEHLPFEECLLLM